MKTFDLCVSIVVFLWATGSMIPAYAENEPNDTPETASLLSPNGASNGTLGVAGDGVDWWKVTIPSDGGLIIATLNTSTIGTTALEIDNYIFDQDMKSQLAGYLHGGSQPEDTSLVVNLLAGTYYIKSSCYRGAGTYNITAKFIATQYTNDTEPNDSAEVAITVLVNTASTGHLGFYGNGYTDLVDWRKVVIPSDGKLVVATYSDATLEIDNYLFDANKTTQLAGYKFGGAHVEDTSEVLNLVAGTYYIRTLGYKGYGSYTFKTIFTPTSFVNDTEPNDSVGVALAFPLNTASTGHLGFWRAGYDDGIDWRKVTTTVDGKLVIATYSDPTIEIDNSIYDQDKTTKLASYKYGGAHIEDTSEVVNLGPGTYYIGTSRYWGYGSYSITNKLTPALLANDTEPNGSIAQAKPLALNTRMTGHLGYYLLGETDENDFYSITLPVAVDTLFIRTDSNTELEVDLYLYNAASTQLGKGSVYGVTEFLAVPKLSAGTYFIKAMRWSGYGSYYVIASPTRPTGQTVGVPEHTVSVPSEFSLSQNYPNPFNPATTVRYTIAAQASVRLTVYDLLGRESAVLVNEQKQPGAYTVMWNAGSFPSGMYLCRLQAGTFSAVKKLILQK